jgi:hypothetical protein
MTQIKIIEEVKNRGKGRKQIEKENVWKENGI